MGSNIVYAQSGSVQTESVQSESVQSVEVTAANHNDKIRQADPTILSVYGREELARYGDTLMSDVLKRLPGVTISENKNRAIVISLRGLGAGYTQVLVNGEVMPDGFAIDSIAPDAIDHIDVMRVAGADTCAQSIAGSINIVLKKKTSETQTEVKLRFGEQQGGWNPGMTVGTSGKTASLGYNLSAVVDRSVSDSTEQVNESLTQKAPLQSGLPDTLLSSRQLQQITHVQREAFTLTPHLNWQRTPDMSLSWQGFLNQVYVHQLKRESENTFVGSTTDFPENDSVWNAHFTTLRNSLTWESAFDDGAKLSVTGGWNFFRRVSFFRFHGNDQTDQLLQTREVSAEAHENEIRLNGKYLAPAIEDHHFSLGWESNTSQRHEQRIEIDQDPQGSAILNTNQLYDASMSKLAFYAQDEWRLSPSWLMYLGLRWEHVVIQGTASDGSVLTHTDSVFSPILQTVWKLDGQRQWRFAVNRTLKAPTLVSLIPRIIRIDNDNGPLNPDQQGNPALRPEKSWGMDIAYERFNADGALVSASAYVRKIDDVTVSLLSQQQNGWLVMPANNGNAVVMGLELETKFSLSSLSADLPNINVHANLNRNWSRVQSVPGPDNVMADQVKLSGNLSLDYQLRHGWTIGGNFSLQTKGVQRASSYLSSYQSPQRLLDLYSVWQVNPTAQLRLSISNILHQNGRESETYQDAQIHVAQELTKPTQPSWRILWEQRF
ncbi:TonB-dependent receptor plug domain-containing protein [Undibacterium sp. SXout20W]